jgi:hypothetical protein
MKIFRQGDVLLRQVKELPKTARRKEDKVLSLGEATGHTHKFTSEFADLYVDVGGKQYAFLVETAVLEHEEHANIEVPEGVYEVVIQRELDLELRRVRPVQD